PKHSMKKIIDYLKQLEFSEIEIRIYLILLKSSSLTVAELAEKSKLNRTALYGHLTELLEKGVIATSNGGRYFYKFLPANIGLTSVTLIYENNVAILNIKQEISGIILHNNDYFNNSKKLFDFLWSLL